MPNPVPVNVDGGLDSLQNSVTNSVTCSLGDTLHVHVAKYSSNITDPTALSGLGGTWIKVGSTSVASVFALSSWLGYGVSGTGPITINCAAAATRTMWIVDKIPNTPNTAGAVGTAVTGSNSGGGANTGSVTLGTLTDANSIAYGCVLGHAPGNITVGTGYSLVKNQQDPGDGFETMTQYRVNVTLFDASGMDDFNLFVAYEVKYGGAPPPADSPPLIDLAHTAQYQNLISQ